MKNADHATMAKPQATNRSYGFRGFHRSKYLFRSIILVCPPFLSDLCDLPMNRFTRHYAATRGYTRIKKKKISKCRKNAALHDQRLPDICTRQSCPSTPRRWFLYSLEKTRLVTGACALRISAVKWHQKIPFELGRFLCMNMGRSIIQNGK